MPSFLSSTFTMVGNTNYNFEYIILAAEKQGATELNWTGFYTSVPGWDVDKLRPDDWLYIKMTEKTRIVYRPIQPFDLSVDPVSKFVEFADYEPADRRSKFSKLRTLREITAGAWPAAPTPDETLIATQLDMVAIAKAAEEAETGRKLLTRTTAPSPKVDDAMSVDLTAAATTTTGTTTTAEATAAADANLAERSSLPGFLGFMKEERSKKAIFSDSISQLACLNPAGISTSDNAGPPARSRMAKSGPSPGR